MRRDPYRRIKNGRAVIVNTKDGEAFRGVLVDRVGDLLFLRGAEILAEGLEPRSVSGEVVIDRENISFIQIPPGG